MSSSDEAEFDDGGGGNDESSYDDNVPIAQLRTNGGGDYDDDEEEGSEEEQEEEWDAEGETTSGRKRKVVNYNEDEDAADDDSDDSDDSDDIPLSQLKKPKISSPSKKKKRSSTGSKKESKKSKRSSSSKSKKSSASPSKKKSSSTPVVISTDASYQSASATLYGSLSEKGLLIQRLLCRWWYSIDWPNPSLIPEVPPPHYDALDGFTGVYVCTSGEKVGHVLDMRDNENRPSFNNFARKTSKELQELLVNALEKQKEFLINQEGKGTDTEKELNTMLKWARGVKCTKADSEAKKELKVAGFQIPDA